MMLKQVNDCRAGRIGRRDPAGSAAVARNGCTMIANGFGLLALFSLIGLLFGDDRRSASDPRNSLEFWTRYGYGVRR